MIHTVCTSMKTPGKRVFPRHFLSFRKTGSTSTVILSMKPVFCTISPDCAAIGHTPHFLPDFFDLAQRLFSSDEDMGHLTEKERIDWQCAAALRGMLQNFLLITGGPGTGKTTTVAKLLALYIYEYPHASVVAAAPTGKAVQRLGESLENSLASPHFHLDDPRIRRRLEDIPRATIHRLLGWQKGRTEFRHTGAHPLTYDLIIVDEASMVDVPLMAKLMAAVKDGAKLILMGDKDQLASVEVGSVFGDLCRSFARGGYLPREREVINRCILRPECHIPKTCEDDAAQPVLVELLRSRRFTADSAIGRLSAAAIGGRFQDVAALLKAGEVETGSVRVYEKPGVLHGETAERIGEYAAYIDEKDTRRALEKLDRFRILCAMRNGEYGVERMNVLVEQELTRRGCISPNGERLYHNKPLIIRQNNYDLGLFNGDTGVVRRSGGGLYFYYRTQDETETGVAKIPVEKLPRHEPLFAMTIHTSQGSEFDHVFLVLPPVTIPLLTRELFYTGITRAKKRVDICVPQDVLAYTLHRQVDRVSGVEERITPWE